MVHFTDINANKAYYIRFSNFDAAEAWRTQLMKDIKQKGAVQINVVDEHTGMLTPLIVDSSTQHIAFNHDPL